MKFTDSQIEQILKAMEAREAPETELFKEFNSDPRKVIENIYNANCDVIFSENEPILKSHPSRILSYENRYAKKIDHPEIYIWDQNRKFLKKNLKVKNYAELKYLVNQISFGIAKHVIKEDIYVLPNSLGDINIKKTDRRKVDGLTEKSVVANSVGRVSLKRMIKRKYFVFITRNRFKLLAVYNMLSKNKK